VALSRLKRGFDSPRERHFFNELAAAPRRVAGRRCFTIFEYCVTGQNRVSSWEYGPTNWAFFSDGSFIH
jgi:hypothetical protein